MRYEIRRQSKDRDQVTYSDNRADAREIALRWHTPGYSVCIFDNHAKPGTRGEGEYFPRVD